MLETNDLFDEMELKYLQQDSFEKEYPMLAEMLNMPRFTISQLGVTARDATYWSQKDILPQLTSTKARRKYTLKQAVWIKFIQQLRNLGISLELIKRFKENVLSPELNYRELLEHKSGRAVLEAFIKSTGSEVDLDSLLKDEQWLVSLEGMRVDLFEISILYALVFRRDMSYVFFQDGAAIPYSVAKQRKIFSNEVLREKFEEPFIKVSISRALTEMVASWHIEPWFEELSLVTEDEKKLLKILRDENVKEVTVSMRGNSSPRVLVTKEEIADSATRVADFIMKNGYQTITIQTRRGKPYSIENRQSVYLHNLPE